MGEPWATALTALVPAIIVTWIASIWKTRIEQDGADKSRADAKLRDFMDRQSADNARLRAEVADAAKAMRDSVRIGRAWCTAAHRLWHDRNNDRQRANWALEAAKQPPIDWPAQAPLPGFEEID